MDFVSNLVKGGEAKPTSEEPKKADSSASDLTEKASAVGADIKAKAAGTAADAIHSVAETGKLDKTTGVGKQAEQAEEYLRKTAAAAGEHKK